MPDTTASDAALLAAADTDARAFRVVYDRHAEMVLGFFVRRGVEYQTALDLTAETFAACWLSRGRFVDHGDGNAGPWLSGIARNILSHAARHRAVARQLASASECWPNRGHSTRSRSMQSTTSMVGRRKSAMLWPA